MCPEVYDRICPTYLECNGINFFGIAAYVNEILQHFIIKIFFFGTTSEHFPCTCLKNQTVAECIQNDKC